MADTEKNFTVIKTGPRTILVSKIERVLCNHVPEIRSITDEIPKKKGFSMIAVTAKDFSKPARDALQRSSVNCITV